MFTAVSEAVVSLPMPYGTVRHVQYSMVGWGVAESHQERWHRVNNLLTDQIGEVDGTTAAVEKVMVTVARMKGLDRTYAVRNLATRAMSCQHYHSPSRGNCVDDA